MEASTGNHSKNSATSRLWPWIALIVVIIGLYWMATTLLGSDTPAQQITPSPATPGTYTPTQEPEKLPSSSTLPSLRDNLPSLNDNPYPSLNFHGYTCTQDCSGHQAGYDWAEQHGIEDPDDCGGNSQSFIEGCQAYAQEIQDEQEQYDSSQDYPY